MNEPDTFTAEHRSWERELVLQYEDGSLPASPQGLIDGFG